jgi:CheY-like chemotaxis protein
VADTGKGMTDDVQARAFEPFFTTKDVNKGSGLGMPQVYGFVQQSGGRVKIDSTVGVGTTVTLDLPRSKKAPITSAAPEAADAAVGSTHGRRGHVLLVEDDREVAALAVDLLNSLRFRVTHVSGPESALGALANGRDIDIVLSDIMMPGGVSGVELAREIRRRYKKMPIVLTTGYVESASSLKDKEFGLLLKPYSLKDLASALGVDTQ